MTAAIPSIYYYCSSHSRMHQQPAAVPVPVRGLNSSQFKSKSTSEKQQRPPLTRESDGGVPSSVTGRDIKQGLSSIQVPRQKYIPVSKSDLLNAIVLKFEWQEEEIDQFLLVSSCLDSILHAEHRSILEEMRMDYDLTHSLKKKGNSEECLSDPGTQFVSRGKESDSGTDNAASDTDKNGDKTETEELKPSYFSPDLIYLFGFSPKRMKSNLDKTSVAVASRFQRAFVQLLYNAQFEELSARDLMLTSALNTDYLLTLPIYVDWKKASESNAIIFRRGYATEKQKGLLIVEKLDYLQSRLLQGIFHILSKPLEKVGIWLAEALGSIIHGEDAQVWIKKLKPWIKDVLLFQKAYSYEEDIADESLGADNGKGNDLPIWLAAQKAVTRYEGILSSIGPRGRLLRKLLSWVGLVPPTRENLFDSNSDVLASETFLRPIFLPRISLNDIWEPATRKYSGNNLWKMLKNIVSILLSQSVLQEPSFEELILLYTKESEERETNNKTEVPSLQLKIYERIPIPDLPVIFPHKKLSFRILDTVRLDVATILGLLAYFINYKFENILSSPSAILLDVIAVTALIIYVTRVALGYKQTWERYQLLVNRTLYEKTIASGFGSVHFLLDASEQQQYKEAILAYAVLLKAMNGQMTCGRTIGDKCERFLYDVFNEKVEMPVDKAIDTLIRLDLVKKKAVNGDAGLQAIPCLEAYEILKERWNRLLRKSD